MVHKLHFSEKTQNASKTCFERTILGTPYPKLLPFNPNLGRGSIKSWIWQVWGRLPPTPKCMPLVDARGRSQPINRRGHAKFFRAPIFPRFYVKFPWGISQKKRFKSFHQNRKKYISKKIAKLKFAKQKINKSICPSNMGITIFITFLWVNF